MDYTAYRQEMLRHCLRFAEIGDPEYAQWAADGYEARSFGALKNLGAKVRQEVARMKAGSNDVPSQAS